MTPLALRLLGCLLGCLLVFSAATVAMGDQDVPRLESAEDLAQVVAETGATVTVINYWATWCPPCRAELPVFKRLQQEFSPREVRIIGVSFDYDPAVLQRFLSRFPLGYQNYIGDSRLLEEMGVGVIPKTVICSPTGSCVSVHEGEVDATKLRTQIMRLLGHGGNNAH